MKRTLLAALLLSAFSASAQDASAQLTNPMNGTAAWNWGFKATGADYAQSIGATGKGVRVAVMDTGVDAGHFDLKGRVVSGYNFSNLPYITTDTVDRQGHGTMVSGIVAGTGVAYGVNPGVTGIASGATIVPVKVFTFRVKGEF
jgi:subtilisin family serine protease